MIGRWCHPNQLKLLESGEEFFPAMMAAIDAAQFDIHFETYIYRDDPVGQELARRFKEAAARKVRVRIVLDGFGSVNLPLEFIQDLRTNGIDVKTFKPIHHWLNLRANFLGRLHRKILTVDQQIAIIGGMNIEESYYKHLSDGKLGRLDYAVEVCGPLVKIISEFCETFYLRTSKRWKSYFPRRWQSLPEELKAAQEGRASFVIRDNILHRRRIEKSYQRAIQAADQEVIIANAYFFPRGALLKALKNAARRGVKVRLILQGKVEFFIVKLATESLYRTLLRSGIEIFEYQACWLHAKVAVIDYYWATVGSLNLDPVSLTMNLEANVIMEDRNFADTLRRRLEIARLDESRQIFLKDVEERNPFRRGLSRLCYWIMKFLPTLARVFLVSPESNR